MCHGIGKAIGCMMLIAAVVGVMLFELIKWLVQHIEINWI